MLNVLSHQRAYVIEIGEDDLNVETIPKAWHAAGPRKAEFVQQLLRAGKIDEGKYVIWDEDNGDGSWDIMVMKLEL